MSASLRHHHRNRHWPARKPVPPLTITISINVKPFMRAIKRTRKALVAMGQAAERATATQRGLGDWQIDPTWTPATGLVTGATNEDLRQAAQVMHGHQIARVLITGETEA